MTHTATGHDGRHDQAGGDPADAVSADRVAADGVPTSDILVHTPGLTEEEIAAVVAVVRASLDEELAAQDTGEDTAARSTARWRHAVARLAGSPREWR